MRISKASWHYKVTQWVWNYPPDNLCAYVRCFVMACSIAPVVFPVLGLVLAWHYITRPFIWVGSKIVDALPERRVDFEEPTKSLWRAWVRAKKEKLCPLIEFEDEGRVESAE